MLDYTYCLECSIPDWEIILSFSDKVLCDEILETYDKFIISHVTNLHHNNSNNILYITTSSDGSERISCKSSSEEWIVNNIAELRFLIYEFMEFTILDYYYPNLLMLHSSVVCKGDKAVVFTAPTHSGKSTLAAYLGANDYTVLSDDCALVNIDTLQVYTYPHPVRIRDKSVLDSHTNIYYTYKDIWNLDNGQLEYLVTENIECCTIPTLLSIICICRSDNDEITPLSSSQAFLSTIKNLKSPKIARDRELVIKLIKRVRVYNMSFSSLVNAELMISELYEN